MRYLYRKERRIYDGYYYFGLTQKEFEYWQEQTKEKVKKRRQIIHFNYIYAYKSMEEMSSCLFIKQERSNDSVNL